MNLKFSSVIDFSETAWPGKTASVVYLAGCPLQCFWCNVPFLVNVKEGAFDSKPVDYFASHFSKLQDNTDAVVFLGGEPFMQSNALMELCKSLKQTGFAIRTETSGYYPEQMRDLLPFLDYVAMDLKMPIEEEAYAKATAFNGAPKLLVSKILSSFAFLEANKTVFKEIRTTLVPGLNDSIDAIQKICSSASKCANVYALQQFSLGQKGSFVNPDFEMAETISKEKMYELAYAAKKTFPEVMVRFNDGSEELI